MNKFVCLSFVLVLALFMASCSDDDGMNCDSLSDVMVGVWTSTALGSGEFECREDGTLIDDDDLIIGGELNGVTLDQKTWVTIGDTIFNVRAEADGSSQFLEADLTVDSYNCNRVTIDFLGTKFDLTRK